MQDSTKRELIPDHMTIPLVFLDDNPKEDGFQQSFSTKINYTKEEITQFK